MTKEGKWMITCYLLIIGGTISWMFFAQSGIFWWFIIPASIISVTGFIKQIRGTW